MRHIDGLSVAALVLVLACGSVVATAGAAASPESGPRPDRPVRVVPVPSLGLLALEENSPYSGANTMWRFDLETNSWEVFSLAPSGLIASHLVYLPARREVISIASALGGVDVLDLSTREWRTLPAPTRRPVDVTDVAVDTRRGHVLAWSDRYDELWTFLPDTSRWSKTPRRTPWPTAAWGDKQAGYTLFDYDSGADRAVLAVLPIPGGRAGSTWLYDPANGRWARTPASPPQLNYGYGEWLTTSVFDPVHRRTVLISDGSVATYDSAQDRWARPSRADWPGIARRSDGLVVGPLVRLDHQVVADPERGRVLMLGGASLVDLPDNDPPWNVEWRPDSSVWAYDAGANTWTVVYPR